jgi:hypothetical protein
MGAGGGPFTTTPRAGGGPSVATHPCARKAKTVATAAIERVDRFVIQLRPLPAVSRAPVLAISYSSCDFVTRRYPYGYS